jgi:hypothetical protein
MEVQLLPVTKVQFECFLAEPNDFGDSWYEGILTLNPRVSYRRFTSKDRERLFVTGVLPEEALAFARWMGKGFDVPTVAEWRALYARLTAETALSRPLIDVLSQQGSQPARIVIEELLSQLRAHSLLDLSLMRGGVVEWVWQRDTWVGLGAPRAEFHANLWDPLSDVVRPIRPEERVFYFGFRLVRHRE